MKTKLYFLYLICLSLCVNAPYVSASNDLDFEITAEMKTLMAKCQTKYLEEGTKSLLFRKDHNGDYLRNKGRCVSNDLMHAISGSALTTEQKLAVSAQAATLFPHGLETHHLRNVISGARKLSATEIYDWAEKFNEDYGFLRHDVLEKYTYYGHMYFALGASADAIN